MTNIHEYEPLWGNWYIEELIGAGSYGVVYKAYQDMLDQRYYSAIKHISIPRDEGELFTVRDELCTDDQQLLNSYFKTRLKSQMQEFDIQRTFSGQPNFVQLYDVFYKEQPDKPGYDLFIRMECLNNIRTRIPAENPDEKEVIKLAVDICTALSALHEKNIIHRDIKLQNVLVSEDGVYKLADFGFAKFTAGIMASMSAKGTPDYQAPEITNNQKVDHRADIYSLGILLYRLMNQNMLPFMSKDGTTTKEEANTLRNIGKPLPSPVCASKGFADIILKACAYDPKARWKSAAEMKDKLEQLYDHKGLAEEKKPGEQKTLPEHTERDKRESVSSKGSKRPRWLKICLIIAAIAVGIIGGLVAIGPDFAYNLIGHTSETVGEYLSFGHYEQDNDLSNGKEDIEWLVLDVRGEKALLISRYALDCKPYNTDYADNTWETCTLRKWLNNEFINEAFTTQQQKAVLTTTVDNSKSQGYFDTNGGNNTWDKVFLLSYSEAWKYFKSDDARECQPTAYAEKQNAYKYSNGNCWWWLRSPAFSSSACCVRYDGACDNYYVNYDYFAVRPALWVDLTSDIF